MIKAEETRNFSGIKSGIFSSKLTVDIILRPPQGRTKTKFWVTCTDNVVNVVILSLLTKRLTTELLLRHIKWTLNIRVAPSGGQIDHKQNIHEIIQTKYSAVYGPYRN